MEHYVLSGRQQHHWNIVCIVPLIQHWCHCIQMQSVKLSPRANALLCEQKLQFLQHRLPVISTIICFSWPHEKIVFKYENHQPFHYLCIYSLKNNSQFSVRMRNILGYFILCGIIARERRIERDRQRMCEWENFVDLQKHYKCNIRRRDQNHGTEQSAHCIHNTIAYTMPKKCICIDDGVRYMLWCVCAIRHRF